MDNVSPLPPDLPSAARRAPWYSWRRWGFNFLTISILAHILFGMGATYLIVQTIQAKRKQTFAGPPSSPNAPMHAIEHKVQMQKKQQTMSAPAPTKRITTTSNVKVALPAMPAMPQLDSAVVPVAMAGMGGVGGGLGMGGGGGGGGGGGAPISFFGLRTMARRIAFLVDYSGSMSGHFRKEMEENLEASLSKLPTGTQILIIPWAGPAWLYNQTASQVADKWRKIDEYDNFALKPGVTQDAPVWVTINIGSIETIMEGMKAQKNAPGGTDWRQPFRYAMQAKPAPDVIFFMTDGQIPPKTASRALSAIDAALKTAGQVPHVNCLWIENKENKPDTLKKLASLYQGEYVEIKSH